jgi:predicted GTPase
MTASTTRKRVVILGAAGRDFHNFNIVYRNDPSTEVVAFTATQIPGVAGRRYPAVLAGIHYPEGIPIEEETNLEDLCRNHAVDSVVFAYSDVDHAHVMHLASRALAAGADFELFGPRRTMLGSKRPVIAVSAVRTGCGKSQIARWLSRRLRERGYRVAALRHPMPYGDLASERVQRFASRGDLDAAHCTAEEREEYEPHIDAGNVVYAGVDYAAILTQAESEADIIVWDGGNNDFPFLKPDLHIVVADALRPNNITTHHPGETVIRMADIVVINKIDAASAATLQLVTEEIRRVNAKASIVRAYSPIRLDDPAAVHERRVRVLVVDDGPTITHGGMPYGAGYVAAIAAGAAEIVDPRLSAASAIHDVYRAHPHIGRVLPAVGYSASQLTALAETINNSAADIVVSGTPLDLAALVELKKPVIRARYEFAEAAGQKLSGLIDAFLVRHITRSNAAA